MSKIRIKNFGPIKEGFLENDGWMDVKKVTVFIGNQGSGKSTVAKLISTFTWIEKALVRGDYLPNHFENYDRFRKNYLSFHRIENYFKEIVNGNTNTFIEFEGDRYKFTYSQGKLNIREMGTGKYELPQVIYVPAERNFVTSIKTSNRNNSRSYSTTSPSLADYAITFRDAKEALKGDLELPIKGVFIEYQKLNGVLHLKGNDYKIRIEESASGFQSLVPLFLVTWYLTNSLTKDSDVHTGTDPEDLNKFRKGVEEIWKNPSLTEDQRRIALSVLSSRFNKTALINIVEEPEQNLFPSSQKEILYSLFEFNNKMPGNKLIITTHSPYLINYLTVSIGAYNLLKKISTVGKSDTLNGKVYEVIPERHIVNPNDLVIYEMDEDAGTISLLGNYRGLPSDENKLNVELGLTNDEYSKLLEIEQLCR